VITANTISEQHQLHSVIKIDAMEETIGQRIKKYRIQAGLSQAALAKACGWKSQSRVGNYEVDSREPTFADLDAIAKAVGVTTGDLLGAKITGTSWAIPLILGGTGAAIVGAAAVGHRVKESGGVDEIIARVAEEATILAKFSGLRGKWEKLPPDQKQEVALHLAGPSPDAAKLVELFIAISEAALVRAIGPEEIDALTTLIRNRRNEKVHPGVKFKG
jgi:transcriptional regulator with XRE-family HTH domain